MRAIFLLGGGAVVIKAATAFDIEATELPATMPRWLRSIYRITALTIVGLLGVPAGWIAFGPGERHFTGSGSFLRETGGRTMFGTEAAMIWVVVLAMPIAGAAEITRAQ